MAKSISVRRDKQSRSASGGNHPLSAIRLSEALTAKVDEWSEAHSVGSRSEAIRCLIEIGISHSSQPVGKKSAHESSDESSHLAGSQIDRMEDVTATGEERASRKRRLLKGPKEFREMRINVQKGKPPR